MESRVDGQWLWLYYMLCPTIRRGENCYYVNDVKIWELPVTKVKSIMDDVEKVVEEIDALKMEQEEIALTKWKTLHTEILRKEAKKDKLFIRGLRGLAFHIFQQNECSQKRVRKLVDEKDAEIGALRRDVEQLNRDKQRIEEKDMEIVALRREVKQLIHDKQRVKEKDAEIGGLRREVEQLNRDKQRIEEKDTEIGALRREVEQIIRDKQRVEKKDAKIGGLRREVEQLIRDKQRVEEKDAEIGALRREGEQLNRDKQRVEEKDAEIGALRRGVEQFFDAEIGASRREVEQFNRDKQRVEDKDAKVGALRNAAKHFNFDKQVAENLQKMVGNCLREATKWLDEKPELIEVLETRVKTLTNSLKEKDLEMGRKLEEKDLDMGRRLEEKDLEMGRKLEERGLEMGNKLEEIEVLMGLYRKKLDAVRLQLEDAHKRECDSLRLEAQQRKDLEGSCLASYLESFLQALREAGMISGQTPPRTNLSDGQQNADRNCSVKPEENTEGVHKGDFGQTETDVQTNQPGTKKRSRDEVVQAVARNVSVQLLGETRTTRGQGTITRGRQIWRCEELAVEHYNRANVG